MSVAAANQNPEDKMEPHAAPVPSAAGSAKRDQGSGPPRTVVWAVRILWIDLAATGLKCVMPIPETINGHEVTVHIPLYLCAFLLAIVAYLIWRISLGYNWARMLYLALTVYDLFRLQWPRRTIYEESGFNLTLIVLARVMHVVALMLIFTRSGSTWFKRPAHSQDPYTALATSAHDSSPPRAVVWAVRLLWVTFAMTWLPAISPVTTTYLGQPILGQPITVQLSVLLYLLMIGAMVYIIVMISRGKNWARMLYLFLFGWTVVLNLVSPWPSATLIANVMSAILGLIETTVLVLLFTRSGSTWFKRPPLRQDPPTAPVD